MRGRRQVRAVPRRVSRLKRKLPLNYHQFTRYSDAVTTTTTSVTEQLTYQFQLTDVIQYTEFTTLFDQYKIRMVEFHIQMISNPDATWLTNDATASANNTVNFYPKFWYIKDYDGGGSDSLSEIKQRVGVKFIVMKPNKTYIIMLQPKVLVQTYKTLTSTGYGPKSMFIDCSSPDVPHYGLNAVIDCLGLNPADATGFRFRVEYKFHLGFKGVR